MKLIRFGAVGAEQPGVVLEDGRKIDVSSFCDDFDASFFEDDGITKLEQWIIANGDDSPTVSDDERLGPPLLCHGKIICIGLNYAAHAKESGMTPPTQPVIFFKATSAICGPNDGIVIPRNSTKTDWEVELAVVIGQRTNYISEAEAMGSVAGYLIHNDYSEREFQLEREGQWVKGKSCDTFAPLGPYLVTPDEVKDPHNLNLWLKVNDEELQNSYTSDLIFNIPEIISYLSQYMTLMPGDIISTGTPSGVGLGLDPQRYLKEGDVVTLGIEGLGVQEQTAINYDSL